MARLRGTGKDPAKRYTKDVIFDVPKPSEDYEGLIALGWAEEVPAGDDPGRTPRQIAEAIIRGEKFTDPHDIAVAESIEDPYALVHDVKDGTEATGGDKVGNPATASDERASDPGITAEAQAQPPERGARRGARAKAEDE